MGVVVVLGVVFIGVVLCFLCVLLFWSLFWVSFFLEEGGEGGFVVVFGEEGGGVLKPLPKTPLPKNTSFF